MTPSPSLSFSTPPIEATALDDVRDVIPLPGYRLAVRFHDGTAGTVDMAAMVTAPTAGVFGSEGPRALKRTVRNVNTGLISMNPGFKWPITFWHRHELAVHCVQSWRAIRNARRIGY